MDMGIWANTFYRLEQKHVHVAWYLSCKTKSRISTTPSSPRCDVESVCDCEFQCMCVDELHDYDTKI